VLVRLFYAKEIRDECHIVTLSNCEKFTITAEHTPAITEHWVR